MKFLKVVGVLLPVSLSQLAFSADQPDYPKQSQCSYYVHTKTESHFFLLNLESSDEAKIFEGDKVNKGSFATSIITQNTRLKGYTTIDVQSNGDLGQLNLQLKSGWNHRLFGTGSLKVGGTEELIFVGCVELNHPEQ